MTSSALAASILVSAEEHDLDVEDILAMVRDMAIDRANDVERDVAAWRRNKRHVYEWTDEEVAYWTRQGEQLRQRRAA